MLGQKVAWTGRESWRAGTQVAVFGLRRTDGVIVASLVESAATSNAGDRAARTAIVMACG